MPVMIHDGKVLIRDGAVAMSDGCCCGGTCGQCNPGTVPQFLFLCLEPTDGPSAMCAAVNGLWKLVRRGGGGDYLPAGVDAQCSWYQERSGFGWLAWRAPDRWKLRCIDVGSGKVCAEYETHYTQIPVNGNCCDAYWSVVYGGPVYDYATFTPVCPDCASVLPSGVSLIPRGGDCPEACNPELYTLLPMWHVWDPDTFNSIPFPYSQGPPSEEGGGPTCNYFSIPPDYFNEWITSCLSRTEYRCADFGPEPCGGPAMYGTAEIVGGALVVKYYARVADGGGWTHFVSYEGPFADPDNYCARPGYHGTGYTDPFPLTRTFNLWMRDEYGTLVPCTPDELMCEATACGGCEW